MSIRNSFLIGVISLLIGWGCAPSRPVDDSLKLERLNIRCTEYWQKRLHDDDLKELYEKFEFPQNLPAFEEYKYKAIAIRRITISNFDINNIILDGDNATVKMEFALVLPLTSKPFKEPLADKWIWKDGQWYHIFR